MTDKKKKSLLSNHKKTFGNIQNQSNEVNDDLKNAPSSFKNFKLNVNEKVLDEYRIVAFDFYLKNNHLSEFNNSNFLKVSIINIYNIFEQKYGSVIPVDDNIMALMTRKGGIPKVPEYYNHINTIGTSYKIENYFVDKFYSIAYTFFFHELKDKFQMYSLAFFFYELVKIAQNEKFTFYSVQDLKNMIPN